MINVLIIEDEIPSQLNLKRSLAALYTDVRIVGSLDSVRGAVKWITENPDAADIIFMDVQLSDGICFEIFKQCTPKAKVVITTAYDNYALEAFRVQTIDYLLKPIEKEALHRAVEHCRSLTTASAVDYAKLAEMFSSQSQRPQYKDRFIVKIGDKILIVKTEEIGYFVSEDKTTYLVTDKNRRYIMDESLDTIEEKLDPNKFFRICRSHIVSIHSIRQVTKHFGSRLKIQLSADEGDLFVSRARVPAFLEWLGGEK